MVRPTALVILDGFGISTNTPHNAIAHAYIPHLTNWLSRFPHAILAASGDAVGLPKGFIGNSEVGHCAIGTGRIIKQIVTRWLAKIEDSSFFSNKTLQSCLQHLHAHEGTLHIMGLLSNAGVHCHEKLIYACIKAGYDAGIKKIVLHLFLDGRDTPPQSASEYLKNLEQYLKNFNNHVIIGSIHGRFYAMDRDNNWQRTEKTYRALTQTNQSPDISWEKVIENEYMHGITDEFIPPTQLHSDATVHNGDGIIFCNIRPDRARQLTACFVNPQIVPFITKPINIDFFITPVKYGSTLPTKHLFNKPVVINTLKEQLTHYNKTIFTIAETEKYAHVTYFFNGEKERAVNTETCVLIPSLKVESYKEYPHMSAEKITDTVLHSLQTDPKDFYLINYANADMVGHTGDYNATIQAIEFLDIQLSLLYDQIVVRMNGTLFITADHGKAEELYDEATHQPKTAHTCNNVPFIMITQQKEQPQTMLPLRELSDIAPFILKTMNIPIPDEMKK